MVIAKRYFDLELKLEYEGQTQREHVFCLWEIVDINPQQAWGCSNENDE